MSRRLSTSVRNHRHGREMSSRSYASTWKYCCRSGTTRRSQWVNAERQTSDSGMPVSAFAAAGFEFAAWISSRNQTGYSYRS